MAEHFLSEIRMFPGIFCPSGWHECNGQMVSINSNVALFSLLGTTYGGDGRTTFGLPDLRGRSPIHVGQGPGLSVYSIGQKGGVESVELDISEMPSHNHEANTIIPEHDHNATAFVEDTTFSANLTNSDEHYHLLPDRQHGLLYNVSEEVDVLQVMSIPKDLPPKCTARYTSWRNGCRKSVEHISRHVENHADTGSTELLGGSQRTSAAQGASKTQEVSGELNGDTVDVVVDHSQSMSGKTTIDNIGGGKPHENRQPYLAVRYCIAAEGTIPTIN